MKLGRMLAPVASLCLLTACAGSGPAGPIDLQLPSAALRVCRAPGEFFPVSDLTQAQAEIATGRMGDELLRCGAEKAALAAWAQGVAGDLGE